MIAGKAKGVLFEDDGDGYEFTRGGYLLTTYVAELESSVVTVRISETEGSWKRPKRRLHVQLLLGRCAMVYLQSAKYKDLFDKNSFLLLCTPALDVCILFVFLKFLVSSISLMHGALMERFFKS